MMVVLLVILMFAVFITLDYLVGLGRARGDERALAEPAVAPALSPVYAAEPVWVAGYQLPEELHYHPGHTWVRVTGRDTAVVGLDDFAGKLIGPASKVALPEPGTALEQGATGFGLDVGGRTAELLAPVDGEVLEINQDLLRQASLATDDPYGRGWLLKVRSGDLARSLRNLMSGSLARKWMQDARERLELQLMSLSGSVLQDGGEPVADLARHLPPEDWRRLVNGFLLTGR